MEGHGQSRCPPPGIALIKKLRGGRDFSYSSYQASVLIITFIAYAMFHMSRKPPSIVKSVLDPEGSVISTLGSGHYALPASLAPSFDKLFHNGSADGNSTNNIGKGGWAPFDGKTGKNRLGEIDVAFLASYAFGMYFAGHLGDRLDLRKFLSFGMVSSGFFVCLFGMGRYWNIHRLEYFLLVQMAAGLFQATGWPSVVTIVGNWFGKKKRGLIMGIWNAHTSVGNILGSLIAAAALKYGWGWSFIIPGTILAGGGLLVWAFLAVRPEDLGLPCPHEVEAAAEADEVEGVLNAEQNSEHADLLASQNKNSSAVVESDGVDLESQQLVGTKQTVPELSRNDPAVGFLEAWRIPGVATFALCLFFSKLVAYTFLYWLPFYIKQTPIAGKMLDEKTAGQLSTLFDVGGVVGGILAGHISDKSNARAITAAGFVYCAIPALFLYRTYGSVSLTVNIILMVVAGMLINGPYALITTAVSADLGTHSSLKGNGRALATVTAIIDGTGSLGAAIGPLLTGFLSGQGWGAVFIMLMMAALFAGLLLTKLVVAEVVEKLVKYQRLQNLSETAREQLTDLLLGRGGK